MPSRLLDLAEVGSGRVKLVLSHEIPSSHQARRDTGIRYATLSYCWGDTDTATFQSRTTVHNLEDRISGFDVIGLSPVIQDAIQVSIFKHTFLPIPT